MGPHTVTMTATDKNGGASTAATTTITVSGTQAGTDPGNAGKTALFVSGTGGNDTINVTKPGGKINATLNGATLGSFTPPTGHLIILGGAGNDTITIDPTLTTPRIIYGGDGNDTISGGNGNGIDVGGSGNDTISTGNGLDILIGGSGADHLNAGNGSDLLVAGSTSYDDPTTANIKSLFAIQAEWTGGATYQQKINHLTGVTTGGLNGITTLVPGSSAFDDTSVDTLTGGGSQDWFLANVSGGGVLDTLTDRVAGEVVTDL